MDGLVTLDDYSGSLAYAEYDEVRDLAKALSAGADINNPGAVVGGGFPLRVESLDQTLKVVTFQQKDLIFWKDVPKKPAYNTVEEVNRLSDVGHESGIYVGEGDLPEEDSRLYERLYTIIKFMGTVCRVTHPLMVVKKALPDSVLAAEARAGTLKLLKGVELGLWDGDSTCLGVEFDGFFRKMLDGIVGKGPGIAASAPSGGTLWHQDVDSCVATGLFQDMRNAPLLEDDANEIVTIASDEPNHGEISDVYMPFKIAADFSKQFYSKERGSLSNDGEVGTVARVWNSNFGKVRIRPSKFVRMSAPLNQTGMGDVAKRPNPPTLSAATSPALAGGTFPGFGGTTQGRTCAAAVDGTGNYYYQVSACNRYGESAPLSIGPVAVTAGDQVNLAIVDGSAPGVTDFYRVARSYPGVAAATSAAYIFKAKRTAASQTIIDVNRFIPWTARCYWIQRNLEAFCWRQLLPLLKVNLAQIDLTMRFALMLYGALDVYAPRKHGIQINVGRLV
jgi:hypothetical protein